MQTPAPRGLRLLIVWWSGTGGTRQLVEAAVTGARSAAQDCAPERVFDAIPLHCDHAWPTALLRADALLFAAPEHLGSLAGPMKGFFDRCYYPLLEQLEGRPYGTIVCAGSDGQGALRQIERIATGWRLRRVADALIASTHAQTPERILAPKTVDEPDLERAATLGATLAAGTLLGLW